MATESSPKLLHFFPPHCLASGSFLESWPAALILPFLLLIPASPAPAFSLALASLMCLCAQRAGLRSTSHLCYHHFLCGVREGLPSGHGGFLCQPNPEHSGPATGKARGRSHLFLPTSRLNLPALTSVRSGSIHLPQPIVSFFQARLAGLHFPLLTYSRKE